MPWLALISSIHFTERRNNSAIVQGGGWSERWRQRPMDELGIEKKRLVNANVHVEADVLHSSLIWEVISRHVTDEQSYQTALAGAALQER